VRYASSTFLTMRAVISINRTGGAALADPDVSPCEGDAVY
jgi:hypothetical protein